MAPLVTLGVNLFKIKIFLKIFDLLNSAIWLSRDRKVRRCHLDSRENITAFANLSGENLSSHALDGLDLEGINLSKANLSKANLSQCNMAGANLRRANLRNANLTATNMEDATLTEANLRFATFLRASFLCANLQNSLMGYSDSSESDFRMADLSGARMEYSTSMFSNFQGANLNGADLSWANLTNAVLVDADLRNVNFRHAILDQADLRGARIDGAFFKEASIKDTQFDDYLSLIDQTADEANLSKVREVPKDDVKAKDLTLAKPYFSRDPTWVNRLVGDTEGTNSLEGKKVHEICNDLNMTDDEVLSLCKKLGIDVKHRYSIVSKDNEDQITAYAEELWLNNNRKPENLSE